MTVDPISGDPSRSLNSTLGPSSYNKVIMHGSNIRISPNLIGWEAPPISFPLGDDVINGSDPLIIGKVESPTQVSFDLNDQPHNKAKTSIDQVDEDDPMFQKLDEPSKQVPKESWTKVERKKKVIASCNTSAKKDKKSIF